MDTTPNTKKNSDHGDNCGKPEDHPQSTTPILPQADSSGEAPSGPSSDCQHLDFLPGQKFYEDLERFKAKYPGKEVDLDFFKSLLEMPSSKFAASKGAYFKEVAEIAAKIREQELKLERLEKELVEVKLELKIIREARAMKRERKYLEGGDGDEALP